MLSRKITISLITLLAVLSSLSVFAESVFMKSGDIYEGRIIKENDTSVVLVLKDRTEIKIQRRNIIRILLHNSYKQKKYLYKMNGDVIDIYLVDEDADSYTYRKELYSSDEYRISRDDVDGITKKQKTVTQDINAQGKKEKHNRQVKPEITEIVNSQTDGFVVTVGAGFPYGVFGFHGAYYMHLDSLTTLAPYCGPGVIAIPLFKSGFPISFGSMLIFGKRHRLFIDLTGFGIIGHSGIGGSLGAGYEFCANNGIVFRISATAAFIEDDWCPYPLPAVGIGYKF